LKRERKEKDICSTGAFAAEEISSLSLIKGDVRRTEGSAALDKQ
jgi:hypothetical protein